MTQGKSAGTCVKIIETIVGEPTQIAIGDQDQKVVLEMKEKEWSGPRETKTKK